MLHASRPLHGKSGVFYCSSSGSGKPLSLFARAEEEDTQNFCMEGRAMSVEAHVSATAQITGQPAVKKRVFSGIQPTGNIHLGNYLGAIRNWVQTQEQFTNIFCIVDLHAITLPIDPKELHFNSRKLAALYLACGLDPQHCNFFIQSHVRQHAEASWILSCFTPMGWLNRMTQFKIKAGEHAGTVDARLYCYPILMACDVLLYQAHLVAVGYDQGPHIELMRDLAQPFNSRYQEQVFTIPEAKIGEAAAR